MASARPSVIEGVRLAVAAAQVAPGHWVLLFRAGDESLVVAVGRYETEAAARGDASRVYGEIVAGLREKGFTVVPEGDVAND